MSEPLIRRRSLPGSLRYLAQKLDGPLSDAERVGVALTLNSLADELDPSPAESLREKLIYFTEVGVTYEKDRDKRRAEAARLVDEYVHELAEQQRAAAQAEFEKDIYIDELSMGFVRTVIDLIDAHAFAGPVRPGEEPTPPCQSPTCDMNLSACVCGTPFGKEPTT